MDRAGTSGNRSVTLPATAQCTVTTGRTQTMASGSGTKDDPWVLKTPPGTSDYTIYGDDAADPPVIVCQVGSTKLTVRSSRCATPYCTART